MLQITDAPDSVFAGWPDIRPNKNIYAKGQQYNKRVKNRLNSTEISTRIDKYLNVEIFNQIVFLDKNLS